MKGADRRGHFILAGPLCDSSHGARAIPEDLEVDDDEDVPLPHLYQCSAFQGQLARPRRSPARSNRERDARKRANLEAADWRVIETWECDLRDRVAEVTGSVRDLLDQRVT